MPARSPDTDQLLAAVAKGDAQALNARADDDQGLAREIAGAFGTLVEQYREYYKLTAQEAISRASDRSPTCSSTA